MADNLSDAEAVVEALMALQKHRRTWRLALVAAMERELASPENWDDRSYWPAEIAAFDQVLDALSNFQVVVLPGPNTGVK